MTAQLGLDVDIEHHPVLLPDTPPEGSRIPDLLKARYGVTVRSLGRVLTPKRWRVASTSISGVSPWLIQHWTPIR